MECKCATIQDAWKWARQLPFKTDALIQIVFATGPLAKGCVSIPRKEFLDGFAAYAIFHFDRDAKCAKLLGALTNAVLPTRGNVFIRLSELSLLLVRQTGSQAPLTPSPSPPPLGQLRKDEFTLTEAEQAVRLRFRALQNPKGPDAIQLMQQPRADAVSRRVAFTAATTTAEMDDNWLRSEIQLCERFMSLADIQQMFPGATTLGAAAEFQRFFNSNIEWVGPVPFELVPPNTMRAHQVVLIRGNAYVPLYTLKRAAARFKTMGRLREINNPMHLRPADPRVRALCSLWLRLLKARDQIFYTPVSLKSMPLCMQHLMTKHYPVHKHRLVTANVLSRLGHSANLAKMLLPAWTPLIERKHSSTTDQKKKEITRTLETLGKTYTNASYNCFWMRKEGLCPHFRFPENTAGAALKACFGAVVPEMPSPVAFVRLRGT